VKKQNKSNNVLPFLARPRPKVEEEDPLRTTALFQIGSTRFAMHIWFEPLPPVPQQLLSAPGTNKKTDLVLVREGAAGPPHQPKTVSRRTGMGGENAKPSRSPSPLRKADRTVCRTGSETRPAPLSRTIVPSMPTQKRKTRAPSATELLRAMFRSPNLRIR
jgi:hypothetical protein